MSQPTYTKKMRRAMGNIPAKDRDIFFVDEQKLITTYVSPGQIINPTKFLKKHGIKSIKK